MDDNQPAAWRKFAEERVLGPVEAARRERERQRAAILPRARVMTEADVARELLEIEGMRR